MTMSAYVAMSEESVRELLAEAGASVMSRSGRTENYGAPRDFSFEVRALFPNGLGLHVVARQFNYRDPWEGQGRVNDLVDVSLTRNGAFSSLPKGYPYFQGKDLEEGVDEGMLRDVVACVVKVNPKIYALQEMVGD